jgi:hypothetical protein
VKELKRREFEDEIGSRQAIERFLVLHQVVVQLTQIEIGRLLANEPTNEPTNTLLHFYVYIQIK